LKWKPCLRINSCACGHPGGLELTRRAVALCAFPAGARLADIGCGTGASVRMLREQGYACVGFDVDRPAGNFPAAQARAEALPVARESLHGILCECVISLLREPERLARDFWELCRFGGRLLVTDVYRKIAGPADPAVLLSCREFENVLQTAGWRMAHFEDCSRALKEYAARLLWQADEHAPPQSAAGVPWRDCGYGLWIAHKEAL